MARRRPLCPHVEGRRSLQVGAVAARPSVVQGGRVGALPDSPSNPGISYPFVFSSVDENVDGVASARAARARAHWRLRAALRSVAAGWRGGSHGDERVA